MNMELRRLKRRIRILFVLRVVRKNKDLFGSTIDYYYYLANR
jgi:hypothetical protein